MIHNTKCTIHAVLPRSGKKGGKESGIEGLPARFVSAAMAAFQGIIGKGKKKE